MFISMTPISPGIFVLFIACYFILLLLVSYLTTRKVDEQSYFIGNRNSVWYLVAIGMISDSLSGVTFISVPGKVEVASFSYLQTILGYILGYVVIATVLLPLYYNRNLTSIYTYLQQRFGPVTQKTGPCSLSCRGSWAPRRGCSSWRACCSCSCSTIMAFPSPCRFPS